MTQVKAPYKKPTLPDLTILLEALQNEILHTLNCVKIGVIEAFDAGTATRAANVNVRIAFTQVTSVSPDGTRTLAEYAPLYNVPVLFPNGGGFTLTFPVAIGDECIVLFNDKQIDNWLLSGIGQPPSMNRTHDLSDGIAIVGLRNNTRALANISTSSTQLRTDDGQTFVDVSAGKIQLVADEVVIHGRNKTTFDAGGTGFVYTPSLITTYTDGVTSNHNPPNPPEVPT